MYVPNTLLCNSIDVIYYKYVLHVYVCMRKNTGYRLFQDNKLHIHM